MRLPGRAGDIVRLGLAVGEAGRPRFAWGRFVAPRVLGTGGGEPLEPEPISKELDARADPLRRSLAAARSTCCSSSSTPARARSFGAYGYPRETTPEIDRLASEGVVFERVYTPAVYTLGAMSSVWTSQYPDRHHSEVSFSARLPKDRLTLAELLSAQGVHTAGFVANAVAGQALRLRPRLLRVPRGVPHARQPRRRVPPGAAGLAAAEPRPSLLRLRPLPRAALSRTTPSRRSTRASGPTARSRRPSRRDSGFFQDVNQGRRPFSEEEREHLVRLYDGNLAFADQEVGAIVRALEAEGLLERTVVIVAADHGEELLEHGWIGHNVHVFEPSVRVPLIVRFPKGTGPTKRRVPALSDLLDVAPTIADVFGVLGKGGSDREFQGRSLLPVLEGAPGKPAVLSRSVWDRPRYALRDERFKFFYDTRSGEEAALRPRDRPGRVARRRPGGAAADGLLPPGAPRVDAAARPPRARRKPRRRC